MRCNGLNVERSSISAGQRCRKIADYGGVFLGHGSECTREVRLVIALMFRFGEKFDFTGRGLGPAARSGMETRESAGIRSARAEDSLAEAEIRSAEESTEK